MDRGLGAAIPDSSYPGMAAGVPPDALGRRVFCGTDYGTVRYVGSVSGTAVEKGSDRVALGGHLISSQGQPTIDIQIYGTIAGAWKKASPAYSSRRGKKDNQEL